MRNTKRFSKPVKILGVEVDSVAYGPDHALQFFVSGYDKEGKCILDRDAMGMAMVKCPNGFEPLTLAEYQNAVYTIQTSD